MQDDMKRLIIMANLEKIHGYTYSHKLSGGNASTILLYQNDAGEKLSLKLLIAPRGDWELKQFQEEAEVLARFKNLEYGYWPKILVNYNKVDGLPIYYFGLQHLEGITLKAFIENNPLPWDWQKSTYVIWRICRALGPSILGHVHRDLHFGNLLVTDPERLLTAVDEDEEEHDPGLAILDAGSVFYILRDIYEGVSEDRFRLPGAVSTWSPEMFEESGSMRYPHDIWALGIMFHHFLTGHRPVEVNSIAELHNIFEQELCLPKLDENGSIPEGIKLFNKNLLSLDPNKRLLTGEICSFCYDVFNTDLLSAPKKTIELYLQVRGRICICARCNSIATLCRCETCHQPIDDDNSLSIGSFKNLFK